MAASNPNKRSLNEVEEAEKTLKRAREEESDSSSDSSSDSDSGSNSSSDSSDSDSEDETQSTSKTPDLHRCPLSLLMSNYGDDDSPLDDSPILDSDPQGTGQPLDPVFVDEESSGEAVAHAADQDLEFIPPLPEFSGEKPPEPKMEPESDGDIEMEATEEANDYDSDESFEELDAELDRAMDQAKDKEAQKSVQIMAERTRYQLVDKGKNHFDVLPNGWVAIQHISGMPIYLHRPTRSVTLSRPYHLGAASARRHPVPINAIPCLNYKKALEKEEEDISGKNFSWNFR